MDLVTKFQKETRIALDTSGLDNPGGCKARRDRDDDDDDDDDDD
jgi:hypothetical protein